MLQLLKLLLSKHTAKRIQKLQAFYWKVQSLEMLSLELPATVDLITPSSILSGGGDSHAYKKKAEENKYPI